MNGTPLINDNDSGFRDKIATVNKEGKREWVFPAKPKGQLHKYRIYTSITLLAIFFSLPFIKVDGDPLFLFNVLQRKFIIFGMIFWPQDFFIFGLGMLIFIVFIALFTVIYGRVFCGWACPQTIFMEMIFRKIEYWIDGDAMAQRNLAKQAWNFTKIRKRVIKLSIFFLISFIIANTFLAYIIGIDDTLKILTQPRSHGGALASLIVFTGVFFFVFSWMREQVCLIVCPYGRMQGVLLDRQTVVVAYDYQRGEPRHKQKKGEAPSHGDCIDCGLCVRVCPMGMDIRNGLQMECVNCTACIDACDKIMDSINQPRGLIRLDSENGIRNKEKLKFTTRMKAYTAVLIALIAIETGLILSRSDYDATILRAKGMLFQEQPDNKISNLYTIKLVNKTRDSFPVTIKVENLDAQIKMVGKDLRVKGESVSEGEFFILLNRPDINKRKMQLKISLYSNNKKIKTIKTSFLGPVNKTS